MITLLQVDVGVVIVLANAAHEMGAFVLTTFDDEFHHDAQITDVKCWRQQKQKRKIKHNRQQQSEELKAVRKRQLCRKSEK